ncbi:MAG TPA: hypothetical protein PK018_12925 [Candidatus Competibacter sp.]|nr:hypothetical protein [Candidatus Competibacteraceae bacterium]HPE73051.1 hypothetical protein [Candidatus Competibacter sp.]HRW67234.1 hypothetical protein [Candidatus Competibacter sp.]
MRKIVRTLFAQGAAAVILSCIAIPVIAQNTDEADRHPRQAPKPVPHNVEADRSLLITNLGVVEDPMRTDPTTNIPGVWTFRHLIEQMAGDQDPAEFALRWLETWEQEQVINGRRVPARPDIRRLVIDPWLQASGGQRLDLRKAPFKLLAIVSRIDLREHNQRKVKNAGEGRFIFGMLDEYGLPLPPVAGTVPGGFMVIFEYEMSAETMDELRHWAEVWSELSRFTPGGKEYNAGLEAVTRRFTDADAAPSKPNGSALAQIRTNEVALGLPWELREFVIDYATGLLRLHPVALTPDTHELNGTETLAALINTNERRLLDGTFDLAPQWFGGVSASGPFQLTEFPDADKRSFTVTPLVGPFNDIPWSAADIVNNDARHVFALNTCSGCHRGETGTGFVHVGFPERHALPNSLAEPATLSGFLTGIELMDPVDGVTPRRFADLERRRQDLEYLLSSFAQDPSGPNDQHKRRSVH